MSEKQKHTPGPWVPEFGESCRVRAKQDGGKVAIMMNLKGLHGLIGRRTGAEVAANARLIAAAPELLEALEYIMGDSVSFLRDTAIEKARSAIAKAEGKA